MPLDLFSMLELVHACSAAREASFNGQRQAGEAGMALSSAGSLSRKGQFTSFSVLRREFYLDSRLGRARRRSAA